MQFGYRGDQETNFVHIEESQPKTYENKEIRKK